MSFLEFFFVCFVALEAFTYNNETGNERRENEGIELWGKVQRSGIERRIRPCVWGACADAVPRTPANAFAAVAL